MSAHRRGTSALAAAGISFAAASALAQSAVERPITVAQHTVRFHLEVGVLHPTDGPTLLGSDVGVTYGVTDHFEVELHPAPLSYTPTFRYGAPNLIGTYAFYAAKSLELAAHVEVTGGATSDTDKGVVVVSGFVALERLGTYLRLDETLDAKTSFESETKTFGTTLLVAVTLALRPVDVAILTGFDLRDWKTAADSSYVPLGATAHYVVRVGEGFFEVGPVVNFSSAFHPAGGPTTNFKEFEAGIDASLQLGP